MENREIFIDAQGRPLWVGLSVNLKNINDSRLFSDIEFPIRLTSISKYEGNSSGYLVSCGEEPPHIDYAYFEPVYETPTEIILYGK